MHTYVYIQSSYNLHRSPAHTPSPSEISIIIINIIYIIIIICIYYFFRHAQNLPYNKLFKSFYA